MHGWKTIMFNAILVLVGLAEGAGVVFPENFAADINGFILAGVGIIGVILRAITNSPVGWKSSQAK